MKTQVEMQRYLFEGGYIKQQSKTGFFSATDLKRVGDQWREDNGYSKFDMSGWFMQKGTKEFIAELEAQFGTVKVSARGRGKDTWVHPYLFIDMALAINPKLKIAVYGWLFDHLLKYRNDSGDSWKYMSGALYDHTKNKTTFPKDMIKVAARIKKECGLDENHTWQQATEKQLEYRDKLQRNIGLLAEVLTDNRQAFLLGIEKTKREFAIPNS